MLTRLFDLTIASLFVIITGPIMLIAAIMIKLDSPGPIVYRSPRVGRNGRRFGLLRFRTVDIDTPTHLPMEKRLTRAGAFIRDHSIDDLPNLFNVLRGEMSIVGPRPTELDVVDLKDPRWQRILTVKPGMLSWAILSLASTYNRNPQALKLQLELDYVQRRSLKIDWQIFRQGMRDAVASRWNEGARQTGRDPS